MRERRHWEGLQGATPPPSSEIRCVTQNGASPVSEGQGLLWGTQFPLTGAGLFLLHIERVPSWPFPPRPKELIFPVLATNANVCCLGQQPASGEVRSAGVERGGCMLGVDTQGSTAQRTGPLTLNTLPFMSSIITGTYLPQAICVTTFPMSSNTFLGLISWFVVLWPS